MVVIDAALYGIFCKTNIAMAHSEMMFIILVALTLLAGVMKNKRIKYSFDIAIIYYASDDLDDGYYYLKNWKNGGYSFVFRKLSKNVDWKLDEILNYDNGWNMIREEYLKLKNANNDNNKKSYVLYLEAINNVYNWI